MALGNSQNRHVRAADCVQGCVLLCGRGSPCLCVLEGNSTLHICADVQEHHESLSRGAMLGLLFRAA